jgi:segregation and condensation protein B
MTMDQASFLMKRRLGLFRGSEKLAFAGLRDWDGHMMLHGRKVSQLHDSISEIDDNTEISESEKECSEPIDPRLARLRTEAVLLVAKTALSPRKLAQLAHLADATQARTLVRQLNQIYEDNCRAIRIEQVAGGFRMFTHPSLAPWLTRLGHLPSTVRISTPMMETLAVVAYHQPVSRANAEAVRGVGCGELLRQLMERDLVRIVGRSEELGRPYLYGTTKRFLQLFGLRSVEALPPIEINALQDDPIHILPNEDLSTSTKELVVSSTIAPVLAETEFAVVDPMCDSQLSNNAASTPTSEIEDEENEYYDDGDDEEEDDDDDWSSDDDEDWDDEDLDDEEDDSEEDLDDDEEDDAWEEVDESDAEEDDDDDDEDWDDDDDQDDDDWDDAEEEESDDDWD